MNRMEGVWRVVLYCRTNEEDSKTFTIGGGQQDIASVTSGLKISKLTTSTLFPINRTFGGNMEDEAVSVKQTSDGGYIIAGYTYSFGAGKKDALVIKTTNDGNIEWSKTYGGSGNDAAESVQQTTDGGYIIAGYYTKGADLSAWLIKIDKYGTELWQKTFGEGWATSVQQTKDGGYIVGGGGTKSSDKRFDGWLIKTDSHGNQLWSKTFGGEKGDEVVSLQQTSDMGYIAAGRSKSIGDDWDAWLFKVDAEGDQQWSKKFGGNKHDYVYSVQQTSDKGYILGGQTGYLKEGDIPYALLIKTNVYGIVEPGFRHN